MSFVRSRKYESCIEKIVCKFLSFGCFFKYYVLKLENNFFLFINLLIFFNKGIKFGKILF